MPKRVDANQRKIVKALREVGAKVQHLHTVGKGCPDILVGYRGVNFLFEIKSENGELTEAERRWHDDWDGDVAIVRDADEAIRYITA